ncbi:MULTISPECIES: 50S ribosomal protein L9 [unclassified Desulfovibrio]|uniref:50S ribosomal protein L9 n=1 Tax=unclassified Desulfovibrio TaxID=2593640 RepID=UPI0013ECF19A|nr:MULTISPECIES: 50S ribosomal protein L9 [unclassified Desulfovibrio]MBD5626108.1 50S ribosomal protein L9 [Desulfovibrio sp.]
MKLILRADVENLGNLGDVVEVKPGYGRNYLLPQGLAMVASPANLKVFEQERNKLQARMDALRAEARGLAARLEALKVVIPMHVGENDKLYGSVTSTIIGDAIAEQGLEVDRRRILMDAPIRTLGEHPVRVRLHADVIAVVPVQVVSDHQPEVTEEELAAAEAEAVAEAVEAVAEAEAGA